MDAARTKPWREDTMCIFYSIAKSICALSVHMVADRGLVDLDAPVATYWPEFAQNGKQDVLVRHIISHYCGVCFNDAAEPGDIFDYDKMIKVLEAQELAWPPGTKGAKISARRWAPITRSASTRPTSTGSPIYRPIPRASPWAVVPVPTVL